MSPQLGVLESDADVIFFLSSDGYKPLAQASVLLGGSV